MNDDRTTLANDDADLYESAGPVWPDEHHEGVVQVLDQDRIVEAVNDVRIGDPMLPSALDDQWAPLHDSKLACGRDNTKLSCDQGQR